MLSVEAAQEAVLAQVERLPLEQIPLGEALGRTVGEDLRTDIDLPPFHNSAMDGYAVRSADLLGGGQTVLQVIGSVPAGGVAREAVRAGTAMRIMTGAPLPAGSDLVIPFEDTDDRDPQSLYGEGRVRIRQAGEAGANIRRAGEDLQRGTVVVQAGTVITPGAIGVLASIGAAQVPVYRKPRVAILATGDELVEVGQVPGPGQIRNSNGYANAAQVRQAGGEVLQLPIARDTAAEVRAQIEQGKAWGADLFLSSGGVSVGDYDVVKAVLQELGALQFWRVRMKPGKPLAFGRVLDVPLLGLPGNPVSAMLAFELFGRPAMLKMSGRRGLARPTIMATVGDRISDRGDRRQYLRVRVTQQGEEWVARLTGAQGSGMVSSMLYADGLLIVPEGTQLVEVGTRLPVMMLYWPEVESGDAPVARQGGDDCC
ncbi:MAG: molybdopterin molybdotransferase MoeA [Herpetosiphon sp.]